MSIDAHQLRAYIVRPVLEQLGLWSKSAENLLMGTAAQESHVGQFLHQLGGGPAKGIFQMEPATHDDTWEHFLRYKPNLAKVVRAIAGVADGVRPSSELMVGNLYYAAAMARIYYLRAPEPLPEADDIEGLAAYWKRYYNTYLGRGTDEEFIRNYDRVVVGGD